MVISEEMLAIIIIITISLHVCGTQNNATPQRCPHPSPHNQLQNVLQHTPEYEFVDVTMFKTFR